MAQPIGSLVLMSEFAAFGPSHILEQRGGHVTVRSVWGEETRVISPQSAGLYRMPLYPGTRVLLKGDPDGDWLEGRVAQVSNGDARALRECVIHVGTQELRISEDHVCPAPPHPDDPVELLEALAWRAPYRFFARWNMNRRMASWYEESGGLPALLGARIRPLGHQVYAARRILWDRAPRFILADEVGLGKTIEAGLAIQSLVAADPELSVLVVAPGSMTRQWLSEIYLRFGARAFTHVDGARWRKASKSQRLQLLGSNRLILSTTVLAEDPEVRSALLGRDWGLVVIDEAHQFGPRDPIYGFFRDLSRQAEGFLVLSATPSKREIEGMLALLALVSPDVYRVDDVVGLEKRLEMKQTIWDRLAFTVQFQEEVAFEKRELDAEMLTMLASTWEGVLDEDPVVVTLLARMRAGEVAAADELVAYVQEFYRVDQRLIRTRRATLSAMGTAFCERRAESLPYVASAAENLLADHLDAMPGEETASESQLLLRGYYHRAFSTTPARFAQVLRQRAASIAVRCTDGSLEALIQALRSDPGPEEEALLLAELVERVPPFDGEEAWLATAEALAGDWLQASKRGCARLNAARDWVRQHLAEDPAHKVLVFTQDHHVAEEFAHVLTKVLGEGAVGLFHHQLAEERLAEVAQHFQRRPACRVLVSDELGGEGRNFQMASALMHLDHPVALARIEQRIGRLDRMGREADRPVRSVLLAGAGAMEQAVLEMHQEVFGVYQQSTGGLEFALPRLQRRISEAACRHAEHLRTLVPELRDEVAEAMAQTDEEFELALDSARPELEKAAELAEVISRADATGTLQDVRAWARIVGLETSPPDQGSIEFKWLTDNLAQQLPGVGVSGPGPHRFHGTFDRQRALQVESSQYFAPGHKLVDALATSLRQGPEGRVTVFTRELGTRYAGRVYMLLLGHCELDAGEGPMPAGLLARGHRCSWPQVAAASLMLLPGQEPAARLVEDPTLKRLLEGEYQGKALEPKVEPGDLLHAIPQIQYLWSAVQEAIPIGLAAIRDERRDGIEAAARDLLEDFKHELGYFAGQAARGSREEAEAARAEIALRERLVQGVRDASVLVDSIALVFGV